jgi:MFS family permease
MFFTAVTMAWNVKPIYGLISDFVPLFGRRRQSYFLLTTSLAAVTGIGLGLMNTPPYLMLAFLMGTMGLGLAFTDVLTDALMVESGKPRGLTGAFQSVQWTASSIATVLVGVAGGYLASRRDLRTAFLLAGGFALVSLIMGATFVREAPTPRDRDAFRRTWSAIRGAAKERDVWVVAAFIFFWIFSPSFGSALYVYQTNVLKFSQDRIGLLDSIAAATGIVGAIVYAPLSRRFRLQTLIVWGIGLGVIGTLGFLLYRDFRAAVVIHSLYGCFGMTTVLAFLDLAARACPPRVEATFFALLMSVYNIGMSISDATGGYLYDWFGYTILVLISATVTALAWVVVPFVRIDRIEARARAAADTTAPAAAAISSAPATP